MLQATANQRCQIEGIQQIHNICSFQPVAGLRPGLFQTEWKFEPQIQNECDIATLHDAGRTDGRTDRQHAMALPMPLLLRSAGENQYARQHVVLSAY